MIRTAFSHLQICNISLFGTCIIFLYLLISLISEWIQAGLLTIRYMSTSPLPVFQGKTAALSDTGYGLGCALPPGYPAGHLCLRVSGAPESHSSVDNFVGFFFCLFFSFLVFLIHVCALRSPWEHIVHCHTEVRQWSY